MDQGQDGIHIAAGFLRQRQLAEQPADKAVVFIADIVEKGIAKVVGVCHMADSFIVSGNPVYKIDFQSLVRRIDPAVCQFSDPVYIHLPFLGHYVYKLIVSFIYKRLKDPALLIGKRVDYASHAFVPAGCDGYCLDAVPLKKAGQIVEGADGNTYRTGPAIAVCKDHIRRRRYVIPAGSGHGTHISIDGAFCLFLVFLQFQVEFIALIDAASRRFHIDYKAFVIPVPYQLIDSVDRKIMLISYRASPGIHIIFCYNTFYIEDAHIG